MTGAALRRQEIAQLAGGGNRLEDVGRDHGVARLDHRRLKDLPSTCRQAERGHALNETTIDGGHARPRAPPHPIGHELGLPAPSVSLPAAPATFQDRMRTKTWL